VSSTAYVARSSRVSVSSPSGADDDDGAAWDRTLLEDEDMESD
jgi:hypothetical protein